MWNEKLKLKSKTNDFPAAKVVHKNYSKQSKIVSCKTHSLNANKNTKLGVEIEKVIKYNFKFEKKVHFLF